MKKLALFTVFAAITTSASAVDFIDDLSIENMYVGAGIGLFSPDHAGFDDAFGYQVFAGYDLDFTIADEIETAVEVGYSTVTYEYSNTYTYYWFNYSSKVEVDQAGIWTSGVVSYEVADQFKVTGRLGYDFGDDDGLLFGLGGNYDINDEFAVRADYVMRDNSSAIIANGIYKF